VDRYATPHATFVAFRYPTSLYLMVGILQFLMAYDDVDFVDGLPENTTPVAFY